MASAAVIDIEVITQAISAENPVGENLAEDDSLNSIYRGLKSARKSAGASERQLASSDEGLSGQIVPEWKTILDLAPNALAERSKDLDIAAWYIEALVRYYGFAGLRDGLQLTSQLIEQFWEHDIYPLPDEDEGIISKVATLAGLNGVESEGTLIAPIRMIPLTQGDHNFSLWHYEQAFAIEKILDPKVKEAQIKDGALTLKEIESEALATPTDFYKNLRDDIQKSLAALLQLSNVLHEKCGRDAPSTSDIRSTLSRAAEIVGYLTKDMIIDEPQQETSNADQATETPAADSGQPTAYNKSFSADDLTINSRDEAFRALLKVSEYFRHAEPHSPISYNLEQAVKWGKMALPELLGELITDEKARREYFRLVGIKEQEKD